MISNSRLVRTAPMAAIFCVFLTGCQSTTASETKQFNFAVSSSGLQSIGANQPSAWKKQLEENKEKLKTLREEQKQKRLARLERLNKKPENEAEYASASKVGREGRESIWDRFKTKNSGLSKGSSTKNAQKAVSKDKFGNLIARYAREHGVPYQLARAVVQVESTFRPNVTGAAGEIGLMQIKRATARGMGYTGSRQALYDPATNLYWGMKYLGKAHQLAGGSTCGTILKYNAGHGAKRMNKISSRYCGRIKRILA